MERTIRKEQSQTTSEVHILKERESRSKGNAFVRTPGKEVINICDGKRLGCIVDLEFDVCTGKIEAVIIPGPGKIWGFLGTECEYVIPFACIRKIGPDIVLVEIQEEKFLHKNSS